MPYSTFRDIVENTEEQRKTFFKLVFGPEATGYVCISYLHHNTRKMYPVFFRYPDQIDEMLESIKQHCEEAVHVYFSTALFETPGSMEKRYIKTCTNLWADLDETDPTLLLVEPSVLIQSSPGKFQALWLLEHPLSPPEAEDITQRIAYFHRNDGTDPCWAAGHLLRVPYTPNRKYGDLETAPVVSILHAKRSLYRPSDFKNYTPIAGLKFAVEQRDTIPDLPEETAEQILERYGSYLPPKFNSLFYQTPDEPQGTWSGLLYALMQICVELGMKREETFVIAKAAACNKYLRDGRPDLDLWQDVLRAYVKHLDKMRVLPTSTAVDPDFITADEIKLIQTQETFVERYMSWAKELSDAPIQYHQAGAFILLSAILSGNVHCPTSFGKIYPNLWFMILAGTTLTRKSTALGLAVRLLSEVDEEAILATEASPEGLLTGLRDRPGKPCLFLKDEFTGLLESITHKEYMAGFMQDLTKLYDGDNIKRRLRRETINVKNPRFLVFAAGIKDKTQLLLTEEHIMSGFIPRFVFITAEADVKNIKWTGPPRPQDREPEDVLRNEIIDLHNHYVQPAPLVKDDKVIGSVVPDYQAILSDKAWSRYNDYEKTMIETATSTGLGYLIPVYDRLTTSTLKAALLLAASRQRPKNGFVQVEEIDILRSIFYAQSWRKYASEIVNGVGKSSDERLIERIYLIIVNSKTGISRGELMDKFMLDHKRADLLFTTMLQRNLITTSEVSGRRHYRAINST